MATDVGMAAAQRWSAPPPPGDALQLGNLLQAYALFADQGHVEAMAALFTADATWDGSELGYGTATGAQAIAELVAGHVRPDEPMVHLPGPPLLTAVSATEVHAVSWCLASRWSAGTTRPLIYFAYEDVCRNDGQGWRFASRRLRRRLPPVT